MDPRVGDRDHHLGGAVPDRPGGGRGDVGPGGVAVDAAGVAEAPEQVAGKGGVVRLVAGPDEVVGLGELKHVVQTGEREDFPRQFRRILRIGSERNQHRGFTDLVPKCEAQLRQARRRRRVATGAGACQQMIGHHYHARGHPAGLAGPIFHHPQQRVFEWAAVINGAAFAVAQRVRRAPALADQGGTGKQVGGGVGVGARIRLQRHRVQAGRRQSGLRSRFVRHAIRCLRGLPGGWRGGCRRPGRARAGDLRIAAGRAGGDGKFQEQHGRRKDKQNKQQPTTENGTSRHIRRLALRSQLSS
jgi:hypothetical protein